LNDLEAWFRQLITTFREEASKLTPDQRTKISNLDDLSSPCQVDVFWFQNEQFKLDFQLLIYQHFKDRSDLEICIHGPIPGVIARMTVEDFINIIRANHQWRLMRRKLRVLRYAAETSIGIKAGAQPVSTELSFLVEKLTLFNQVQQEDEASLL